MCSASECILYLFITYRDAETTTTTRPGQVKGGARQEQSKPERRRRRSRRMLPDVSRRNPGGAVALSRAVVSQEVFVVGIYGTSIFWGVFSALLLLNQCC